MSGGHVKICFAHIESGQMTKISPKKPSEKKQKENSD